MNFSKSLVQLTFDDGSGQPRSSSESNPWPASSRLNSQDGMTPYPTESCLCYGRLDGRLDLLGETKTREKVVRVLQRPFSLQVILTVALTSAVMFSFFIYFLPLKKFGGNIRSLQALYTNNSNVVLWARVHRITNKDYISPLFSFKYPSLEKIYLVINLIQRLLLSLFYVLLLSLVRVSKKKYW